LKYEYHMDGIDSVGENSTLSEDIEVRIINKSDDHRGMRIGSNSMIYPRNRFVIGDMNANSRADIKIGNFVLINSGGYFSGEGGLIIKDYVLIGANTCILSAGHKYHDRLTPIQQQELTYGTITIERDVWIGASSVILEGITIGEGAVIGAGTIVTKDVEPYAVVVGNPGRTIKYRGEKTKTGLFQRLKHYIAMHCRI